MLFIGQLQQIPRPAWPLALGLLANSSMLFGDASNTMGGAVPVPPAPSGYPISMHQAAKFWLELNKVAMGKMVPEMLFGTLYSASLHLLAACLTTSRTVRKLSLITALATLTIIPHTYYRLVPTANLISRLAKKDYLTTCESEGLAYHLDKWGLYLDFLWLPSAVSWATGLGALLGVAGKW